MLDSFASPNFNNCPQNQRIFFMKNSVALSAALLFTFVMDIHDQGLLAHNNNKMRFSSSSSINKQKFLPPIKQFKSNSLTPKNMHDRFFPSRLILPNFMESPPKTKPVYSKKYQPRPPLQIRMQELNKKKREIVRYKTTQDETSPQTIQAAAMTNTFEAQIQKNLKQIKLARSKHNYLSSRKRIKSKQSISKQKSVIISVPKMHDQQKKLNELDSDTLFSKINQIIAKLGKNQDNNQNNNLKSVSTLIKKIKQERKNSFINNQSSFLKPKTQPFQKQSAFVIKHDRNYSQWKKLSVGSMKKQTVQYDDSTYQIQTERIQKIRTNNDRSLKKYFQGKTYLQKLLTYRYSTQIESTNQ